MSDGETAAAIILFGALWKLGEYGVSWLVREFFWKAEPQDTAEPLVTSRPAILPRAARFGDKQDREGR